MITIRKIDKNELKDIFNLVMDLAIFEKEPESVTTTLSDYESAFDSGLIDIIVAEKENDIIGMALYYITFSTWRGRMLYLEDFIVKDEYRSQGVGNLIFDAFIKEAKDLKCNMTKWQVLDWNTSAIKFYKRKGATIEQNWYNGKIIF